MALVMNQVLLQFKKAATVSNFTHISRLKKNPACYMSTTIFKEKWDLVSAVCLERKPIISKEKNEIEKKYSTLLSQIEFENSYLSDHEMRNKQDEIQAELLRKGEDADVDQTLKQTAHDFEDGCVEELNKFHFAFRTTNADKNNDVQSLDRKLDRSLLLLVEQKFGSNRAWALPQGVRDDGETMRQTAERVLKESCGDQLRVRFLGNAPCGFYKYKYPKFVRETAGSPVGAKVFFFKAEHLAGQVEKSTGTSKVIDFKWLVHDELRTSVPKEYYGSVSQFLIEE